MGDPSAAKVRQFRVNPIELGILSILSLIFLNSVYNLFFDGRGVRLTDYLSVDSKGGTPNTPKVQPATFLSLQLSCDTSKEEFTSASQFRLSGALCGISTPEQAAQVVRTEIQNEANQFTASVFTDPLSAKFSTDYIALAPGANRITVKFSLENGTRTDHELIVHRTDGSDSARGLAGE